jgi:hypothetical protein
VTLPRYRPSAAALPPVLLLKKGFGQDGIATFQESLSALGIDLMEKRARDPDRASAQPLAIRLDNCSRGRAMLLQPSLE